MNTKKKIIYASEAALIVIIILGFVFYEEIYWHSVNSFSPTIENYKGYLNRYESGKYREEAKENIDALMYSEASYKDTITAYKKYLKESPKPDKYLVKKAKEKIDELTYKKIMNFAEDRSDTENIKELEKFIKLCLTGEWEKTATEDLEIIFLNRLNKNKTIKNAKAYIHRFPNGKNIKKVKRELARLSFNDANDKDSYQALEKFMTEFREHEDLVKKAEWNAVIIRYSPYKSEMKSALKFYRTFVSPIKKYMDFREFLITLKAFVNKNPNTKYIKQSERWFIKAKVKFTKRKLYTILKTYHVTRKCGNFWCSEYKYPKVYDYYSGVVEEGEIVIYDEPYIRTIYEISGDNFAKLEALIYNKDSQTKFIDNFQYSYKLCYYDCDASYHSGTEGEPLEFNDTFGEIDTKKIDIEIEDTLSDHIPNQIASRAEMRRSRSRDYSESEDVISKTFRGVGNVADGILNLFD